MKITYDLSVNAAYIYLTPNPPDGPYHSYPCDPLEVGGEIILDFDISGRLVGIEVLDASRLLTKDLLDLADIIG